MKQNGEKRNSLKQLLAGLDQQDIYRPVYDPEGNVLAEGVEEIRDELIAAYKSVDFRGKTVVDLGCNFGLFSFLAAKSGAQHVTGVDVVPEIVKGAELLAGLHNLENVSFSTFDFEEPAEKLGRFDMVMLVDFFGKSNIRKQKVEPIINFMKSIANSELLFAIRPLNRIDKDLKTTEDEFSGLYPEKYIANGVFNLLDYISDILAEEWSITSVSDYDGSFEKHKLLFLCRKKMELNVGSRDNFSNR